jgi:hypothetical protein
MLYSLTVEYVREKEITMKTMSETWEMLQGCLELLETPEELEGVDIEELETYMDDAADFFNALEDARKNVMDAMDLLHDAQGRKRFVEHRNEKRQSYKAEDFAFAC